MTEAAELEGRIIRTELTAPYVRLVVDPGPQAPAPSPGQFYMLTVPGASTFLPRPLSFMRYDPEKCRIEFLFSVVGEGTAVLARMCEGEPLILLGPLGRPFDLNGASRVILVGGGRGVAPLIEIAWRATDDGNDVTWLEGARDGSWIYDAQLPAGVPRATATEDGSVGVKGLVTDLLATELDRSSRDARVLSCGPHAMLEAVASLCDRFGVRCQVALEAYMACGYGVCRGCAIPVRGDATPTTVPPYDGGRPTPPGIKYKMCCLDGPVFDAHEVLWEWIR